MKATNHKVTIVAALLMLFLASCQIKWPFNNANNKLKKVATEYPIQGNEEIVIGEFEENSYRVLVQNPSEVTIQCKIVDKKTDKINEELTLKGKQNVMLRAANFQKMIVQNPSNEKITIKLGMDEPIQGLRYQDVKSYTK